MKKLSTSSHTGSDTLTFYDIGDDTVRIVHLQEWSELVGEIEAEEMEKYNVVVHDCPSYGYDGQLHATSYSVGVGIGESVHDSLRSCGYHIKQTRGVLVTIIETHSGDVIAHGSIVSDTHVRLVIAECMYGYGAGERVLDESGNNKRDLLRSARNA